jgi:rSAM/selenodomain-associated transferase 2
VCPAISPEEEGGPRPTLSPAGAGRVRGILELLCSEQPIQNTIMSSNSAPPTISVIIPTYNEDQSIGALLDNLRDLAAEEIIVVDGHSTDRTVEIAGRAAKVILSERSRGIQMNAGANASSGSVLLFLHADVRLSPGGLQAIKKSMDDRDIVGGNFNLRFEGEDWAAAAFTQVNRWRRKLGVFYGDSGIFCRRDIFESLGEFRPWPLLEDYDFARRLRLAGKLALLEEPIWVSNRRWRNRGLLRTLWSWFWIQTLYFGGVSPERLATKYRHVRLVESPLTGQGSPRETVATRRETSF